MKKEILYSKNPPINGSVYVNIHTRFKIYDQIRGTTKTLVAINGQPQWIFIKEDLSGYVTDIPQSEVTQDYEYYTTVSIAKLIRAFAERGYELLEIYREC
jgi:hypothetical protein